MGTIKLLSEDVIAAISAGEVVERPLSVVKELVENSIDAGADRIEITVENGGKSFIGVSDNGEGMDRDDIEKCLLKHATSKISDKDDLFAIKTMGFRGEALYSISKVSKFRLISKRKAHSTGNELYSEGGKIQHIHERGSSDGTIIEVGALFYNIPARRKFLKSSTWERLLITEFIEQMAFLRPAITFILRGDGRDILILKKADSAEERIKQIFPSLSDRLMHSRLNRDGYSGECYISIPDIDMPPFSLFAVNGRVVKDRIFFKVMNDAFAEQRKKSPFIFINFTVPEDMVDVNVHPAKREVKFANNEIVYKALRELIETAVGGKQEAQSSLISPTVYSSGQSFTSADKGAFPQFRSSELFSSSYIAGPVREHARVIGVFARGFLVVEKEDTLLIIDQHAAHERYLYNTMMGLWTKRDVRSQTIIPYAFTVNESVRSRLGSQRESFERLGYFYEEAGPNSYAITAIPAFMSYDAAIEVFNDLLKEKELFKTPQDLAASAIAMAACKEAVKKTDNLSAEELDTVIAGFFAGKTEQYCPHGRNYIISIPLDELEKKFGRKD